ncbi:TRAP transporter small permease subunit [Colwellia psychrerythraea]|uniref:TRAP transporter small permease protein n=1 Tax=Colwellia psychrerythraea TaxID=28229 RepID=A0A099KCK0_COLPS|nr:TRAP transporter small permease subunit [Colwellia psychrerythraea]KGJ87313.1 Tripartite ATP-independent periplasmic transporter DctQ component [Colwellia psychrerythraea]
MTDSLSTPNNALARLMLKIADVFEAIILKVSAVCCWSSALLIVVIICNVTMRYGFQNGLILFEEIQWHLYAIGIMFGLSYAEITNSQVRVDVVASMLKTKTVLKWEIFGAIVFVFPTIFVILFNSFDYVANSYLLGESSSSPLGMPFRWLIKSAIPASFILLAMAVLARLFRNIITITQKEA